MPVASIAPPINPPSASISRTRGPFAVPPIPGLHGMTEVGDRGPIAPHIRIERRDDRVPKIVEALSGRRGDADRRAGNQWRLRPSIDFVLHYKVLYTTRRGTRQRPNRTLDRNGVE